MDEDKSENPTPLIPGALFNTGTLYVNSEALIAMHINGCDHLSLCRDYVTCGNWGLLDANHITMTHEAINNGYCISAVYHLGGLDSLCIITDADRSITTFQKLEPIHNHDEIIEYPPAPLIPGALFNPGKLCATQSALEALQSHNIDYLDLLQRFLTGDWESMIEKSIKHRHEAIREGKAIYAFYPISEYILLYVETNADRSMTSVYIWPTCLDADDDWEEDDNAD